MSYEILVEEREPIDGWSVCTICLNVDRTAKLSSRGWRCAGCGTSTANDTQRSVKDYLTENSVETLEENLREWSTVKGMRAAYKMLRSARFKCLIVLGRRLRGEQPSAAAPGAGSSS